MDRDCPFCALVAGENPHHVVHETERALAFLDANPLAPGHTLVVPRDHHRRVRDLPDDTAGGVFGLLHALVGAVEAAVGADATTVKINDGEAAGQTVPHLHAHVIPRSADGSLSAVRDRSVPGAERPDLSAGEMDAVAVAVRDRIQ
ncbi:MAG: HIT family protein [Halobacteriaceae archaeon]